MKCEICGKEVTNPNSMTHITSKFHQDALKNLASKKIEQIKSIKGETSNQYINTSRPIMTPIQPLPPSGRRSGFGSKFGRKVKLPNVNLKGKKKGLLILVAIIGVLITILSIFIWYPSWRGGISLQQQLYAGKGGGLNYWEFYVLNAWGTNFFWNKTALIGAFLGSIIMSIPPTVKFKKHLRFNNKKGVIFWWTVGFGFFYLVGGLINAADTFAWGNYMVESGYVSSGGNPMTETYRMMYDPEYENFGALFVYIYVYLPIINYVIVLFMAKVVLLLRMNKKENKYYSASGVFIFLGLIFGLCYFNAPLFSLDGVALIQLYALLLGFYSAIILGILVGVMGKLDKNPSHTKAKFTTVLSVIVLLFLILTPLFMSVGPALNLNTNEVWTEQEWNKKIDREIKWTSISAGLDIFEQKPIEELYTATIVNDSQIIPLIRQYDIGYAIPYMQKKIGTSYEALADADIVYINGREYWIAPKTVNTKNLENDPIQTNTELYDHVEGLLIMDTFTGELVDASDTFNISDDYPIFFGELEGTWSTVTDEEGNEVSGDEWADDTESSAYTSDVLLNTGWEGGIDKNNHVYDGDPDGSLTGLEAGWYTANLGLWGYAWDGKQKDFLINRNIKTRVESILLPYLKMDPDPYVVFNTKEHKMYYACSIYTEIPIYMYSTTPIYRLLGLCLVDVMTGELSWYSNPTLDTKDDPTFFLWEIYLDKYPWEDCPNWLKPQMRYPEDLFELQLAAYYTYHVNDPKTWKREDDFYERPEGGDLFYIEMDIGYGMEYVGIDLVKYYGREAETLAGMAVLRHGAHFGEVIFYHTRDSTDTLIGPSTARDKYTTDATQEIKLISNPRNGNTLLYPLAGTMYYYVPTYSESGDLEQLKLAGFINAFSSKVGYGKDAWDAYYALDIPTPPESFELRSDANSPKDTNGAFNLTWDSSNFANTYSIYQSNQTIDPNNNNGTLIVEHLTVRQYPITGLLNGTYYFRVFAINDYGNSSAEITITVGIPPQPPPISYEFDFEESMNLPDGLPRFSISISNDNMNFSAPGINVKLNLTVFSTHSDVNYTLLVAPSNAPLSNWTFINNTQYGIQFFLKNVTLQFGEGILYSGYLNCTTGDIVIYYKWDLIIENGKATYTETGTIIAYI